MTAPDVRTPGGNPANAEQETEHPDCASADAERIAKQRCTWPALAALAGYELRRLADGRWLVTRWGLCKEVQSIAAVRELLARIGGAA